MEDHSSLNPLSLSLYSASTRFSLSLVHRPPHPKKHQQTQRLTQNESNMAKYQEHEEHHMVSIHSEPRFFQIKPKFSKSKDKPYLKFDLEHKSNNKTSK